MKKILGSILFAAALFVSTPSHAGAVAKCMAILWNGNLAYGVGYSNYPSQVAWSVPSQLIRGSYQSEINDALSNALFQFVQSCMGMGGGGACSIQNDPYAIARTCSYQVNNL